MPVRRRYSNATFTKRVDHEGGRHRPSRAMSEPAVCADCGAVYANRRWTNSSSNLTNTRPEHLRSAKITLCPAMNWHSKELSAKGDEIHGDQIVIMVGEKPDDHITHSIARPIQVSLEQTDEGTHAVLAIKSADGVMALMRFRSPMLPEIGDGLVGLQSRPPL